MADLSFELVGVDALAKKLDRLGVDVEAALVSICEAGGEVVRQAAADNAPGDIGANMTMETLSKKRGQVGVGVGPSKKEWYARFVEFGRGAYHVKVLNKQALTIGNDLLRGSADIPAMGARPFLAPALDTNKPDINRAMGKKTDDVIKRSAK